MIVYELVEACTEPYESWETGIKLFEDEKQADLAAEEENNAVTDDTMVYFVVPREVIMS